MAKNTISGKEIVDSVEGESFSSWELVSQSESDDEETYSFIAGDDEDGGGGESKQEEESGLGAATRVEDVISLKSLSVSPPHQLTLPVDVAYQVYHDDGDCDGDDEGSGLDDELVPLELKYRFDKQRIMKIGKREGSRVNKSKKLPYYYNRPGCVYGKHGLGVQHSFI